MPENVNFFKKKKKILFLYPVFFGKMCHQPHRRASFTSVFICGLAMAVIGNFKLEVSDSLSFTSYNHNYYYNYVRCESSTLQGLAKATWSKARQILGGLNSLAWPGWTKPDPSGPCQPSSLVGPSLAKPDP